MEQRRTDYRETMASVKVADASLENIRAALSRDLPEFYPALAPHDGTFVVCASGPSLPQFLDEIRKERELRRPICAVNGAHDFLCENGIEPDYFLTVDPRAMPQNLKRINDHTVYLLSSRCHPSVYDALAGKKIVQFHSWQDGDSVPELAGKQVIGGGTTSGLRAITIGYLMGHAKFVCYGLDSCLAEDRKTKRFTGEQAGKVVDRIIGGRTFYCNVAMALQADEFQEYYGVFPDITIDVKGDGLIAAIIAERKKRGLRC